MWLLFQHFRIGQKRRASKHSGVTVRENSAFRVVSLLDLRSPLLVSGHSVIPAAVCRSSNKCSQSGAELPPLWVSSSAVSGVKIFSTPSTGDNQTSGRRSCWRQTRREEARFEEFPDDPDLHEVDRQEMSRFHFSLKHGADDRRVGGVVLYNIFHGNDNN